MFTLPEKLEFLGAPRFWALVIGAVALYLKTKGLIGEPETVLIATITGGFVITRTLDRAAEQMGASVNSNE